MLTVSAEIASSIKKVWEAWCNAAHVTQWNYASADWHCPAAVSDFRVGGEFHYTMAAKDGSFSFDFWGTFQKIEQLKSINIILGDGRKLFVSFEATPTGTIITEKFEPEQQNPIEMQQAGWQMILDNFKSYVESL